MAASTPDTLTQVRVWDRFIRFFHWCLVAGFATSFLSGEFNWMTVHVWSGYTICLLLTMRVGWGFIGTKYARFSSFLFSPAVTLAYARAMLAGKPPHFISNKPLLGHNPLGALMVFALLGLLLLICLSGLTTLAAIDFEGPLLFLANRIDDATAYLIEDIHESLPVITLGFIGFHLVGVAISSRLHGENLVKSMFTGNKSLPHDPNTH